jgi:hypothetical protein
MLSMVQCRFEYSKVDSTSVYAHKQAIEMHTYRQNTLNDTSSMQVLQSRRHHLNIPLNRRGSTSRFDAREHASILKPVLPLASSEYRLSLLHVYRLEWKAKSVA